MEGTKTILAIPLHIVHLVGHKVPTLLITEQGRAQKGSKLGEETDIAPPRTMPCSRRVGRRIVMGSGKGLRRGNI